eukprot:6268078-Prymnesium_polylepis.1
MAPTSAPPPLVNMAFAVSSRKPGNTGGGCCGGAGGFGFGGGGLGCGGGGGRGCGGGGDDSGGRHERHWRWRAWRCRRDGQIGEAHLRRPNCHAPLGGAFVVHPAANVRIAPERDHENEAVGARGRQCPQRLGREPSGIVWGPVSAAAVASARRGHGVARARGVEEGEVVLAGLRQDDRDIAFGAHRGGDCKRPTRVDVATCPVQPSRAYARCAGREIAPIDGATPLVARAVAAEPRGGVYRRLNGLPVGFEDVELRAVWRRLNVAVAVAHCHQIQRRVAGAVHLADVHCEAHGLAAQVQPFVPGAPKVLPMRYQIRSGISHQLDAATRQALHTVAARSGDQARLGSVAKGIHFHRVIAREARELDAHEHIHITAAAGARNHACASRR